MGGNELTKTRKRTKPQQKSIISPVMIGVVTVAAILMVVGLILLGNQSSSGSGEPVDVSQFPTLGDANAPVTMVEYSDYG